jgi:mannose-1-phosphate guanylyltransferase
MADPLVIPVILCGGGGTRLWPVSREQMPKIFVPLIGATTSFRQVLDRVTRKGVFAPPIVIANVLDVMLPAARVVDALKVFRVEFPMVSFRLYVEGLGRTTMTTLSTTRHQRSLGDRCIASTWLAQHVAAAPHGLDRVDAEAGSCGRFFIGPGPPF